MIFKKKNYLENMIIKMVGKYENMIRNPPKIDDDVHKKFIDFFFDHKEKNYILCKYSSRYRYIISKRSIEYYEMMIYRYEWRECSFNRFLIDMGEILTSKIEDCKREIKNYERIKYFVSQIDKK